jgi:tetratricopeptide (TPR) repeat protein
MSTIPDLVRSAYSDWNDAQTLSLAGCELHDRNRLDLAREVLERALELDPLDRDAWAHLAFAYLRGFQPKKGFDTLRTAIDRTGSDVLKLTLAGFTPDTEERTRLLAEVKGSDDPAVRASAASVRHGAGDAAAFEELRQLAQEHPDVPDIRETWLWANLNALWRGATDVDVSAVLPLVDRWIADAPDRINGHWIKVNLLAAAKDWDGVLAATAQVLARFPDEETMMFLRGRALKEKGDLDRAALALSRAIGMKPSFSGARTELGKVLEAQGRLDLAEEVFREIPRANPAYAGGAVSLALFLARRERWDEAERLFLDAWGSLPPWQQARLKQQPDVAALLGRPRVKSAIG